MPSRLDPVATGLHVAPAPRMISRDVEKEAPALLATLQPAEVRSGENPGRRPRHRPQCTDRSTRLGDPPPAIPAHGRPQSTARPTAGQDAIEQCQVPFVGAPAARFGTKDPPEGVLKTPRQPPPSPPRRTGRLPRCPGRPTRSRNLSLEHRQCAAAAVAYNYRKQFRWLLQISGPGPVPHGFSPAPGVPAAASGGRGRAA